MRFSSFSTLLFICLSVGALGFVMIRSEADGCPDDADSQFTTYMGTINGLDKTDSSTENCKKLEEMQNNIEELVVLCRDSTDAPFIADLGSGDDSGGELSKACGIPA